MDLRLLFDFLNSTSQILFRTAFFLLCSEPKSPEPEKVQTVSKEISEARSKLPTNKAIDFQVRPKIISRDQKYIASYVLLSG